MSPSRALMMQRPEPPLVLASASSSRRNLLAAAGLQFQVLPAHVDEASVKQTAQVGGRSVADTALALADLKAAHVAAGNPGALVIGADQILVCDGVWYDKPVDQAAARLQLSALRGRSHTLATAVTCHQHGARVWHHVAEPHLTMRRFSDTFLDSYLAAEGESVTSTVGAYRLEERGVHLFERIDGDHAAILGLPLLPLLCFLRYHGLLID
jgi:septum formation protein